MKKNRTVIPITYHDACPWVLRKHYAHRIPNIKYAFGLLLEQKVIGVCTFGIPASPSLCKGVCGEQHRDKVLELNRLCINDDAPRNSASFLIGNAIKQLPSPRILVSYADTEMGHICYVYQSTNWLYTGCTKARTDMLAGDGKHTRHNRGNPKERQFRSAKHRYVYFHRCANAIKKALRYEVLPYPKGDSQRYDTTQKIETQMYFA